MSGRLAAVALPGSLLAVVLGSLLALPFWACGGSAEAGPPRILWGEDICDHCRMVISEERHAAAARIQGREYRFDDPGCLLYLLGSAEGGGPAWVHDETNAWLAVEDAWFAVDPEGRTPMASGILAFGSREAAAAAGRTLGAEPVPWTGLRQEPEAGRTHSTGSS